MKLFSSIIIFAIFVITIDLSRSSHFRTSRMKLCITRSTRFRSLSPHSPSLTNLFGEKSGSTSDKFRVRLLADVKDQGRKGDIIMISKPIWLNVLQPKKLAERISDADMDRINAQAQLEVVQEIKSCEETVIDINEKRLFHIIRKVGANGQLFGSVSHKQIIEHLKEILPSHVKVLSNKHTSIVSIAEKEGSQSLVQGEIRKGGKFKIVLKVHPKVEYAEIELTVGP